MDESVDLHVFLLEEGDQAVPVVLIRGACGERYDVFLELPLFFLVRDGDDLGALGGKLISNGKAERAGIEVGHHTHCLMGVLLQVRRRREFFKEALH